MRPRQPNNHHLVHTHPEGDAWRQACSGLHKCTHIHANTEGILRGWGGKNHPIVSQNRTLTHSLTHSVGGHFPPVTSGNQPEGLGASMTTVPSPASGQVTPAQCRPCGCHQESAPRTQGSLGRGCSLCASSGKDPVRGRDRHPHGHSLQHPGRPPPPERLLCWRNPRLLTPLSMPTGSVTVGRLFLSETST